MSNIFQAMKRLFTGKDDKNDINKLLKLAERGDAEAQYNLGLIYNKGQGVTKSRRIAIKWFKRAAEQGYAKAQTLIGYLYFQGEGVQKNYKTAIKWTNLAAKQGDIEAEKNLTIMSSHQQGNKEEAAELLKMTANNALSTEATSEEPEQELKQQTELKNPATSIQETEESSFIDDKSAAKLFQSIAKIEDDFAEDINVNRIFQNTNSVTTSVTAHTTSKQTNIKTTNENEDEIAKLFASIGDFTENKDHNVKTTVSKDENGLTTITNVQTNMDFSNIENSDTHNKAEIIKQLQTAGNIEDLENKTSMELSSDTVILSKTKINPDTGNTETTQLEISKQDSPKRHAEIVELLELATEKDGFETQLDTLAKFFNQELESSNKRQ